VLASFFGEGVGFLIVSLCIQLKLLHHCVCSKPKALSVKHVAVIVSAELYYRPSVMVQLKLLFYFIETQVCT